MKHLVFFITLMAMILTPAWGQVADTVDVENYDLTIDMSGNRPVRGDATLTLRLLQPCSSIALQLVGTVDSVMVNGQSVSSTLDAIPTAGIAVGETLTVRVVYRVNGWVESGGWGGLHIDGEMTYNLGVGFNADPHVVGRALFPCRDNMHDKATYTLRVKTRAGWTAQCGGMLQSSSTDSTGCQQTVWRIAQPTPTYLVSVSQAPWEVITDSVVSLYGTYPLTLGHMRRNEANVRAAFAELDSVVPMFERCFGPYRWGRIGYIATEKGSMEHVNNIALARSFISSTAERAQTTIAHELGHAWFGNLVTCTTAEDMWINEGGASFTSEVAMEAVNGRAASDEYYERNLEQVLRTTHVTDGGYYALSGVPHSLTYGSTTYDKGWMVWHSLRGMLGEERFYAALRQLMASCAFGNIDAAGVRDSLSLYTGVDLTNFFAFHVFNPGFVDYRVSMNRGVCNGSAASVTIDRRGVGTTAVPREELVPVTFFSPTLDTATRWLLVDEDRTDVTLRLPFEAAFCVLDYRRALSDAATLGELHPVAGGSGGSGLAHFAARANCATDIYVEHHWRMAEGQFPGGIRRWANRYWVLSGQWDTTCGVEGRFGYVRSGYEGGEYTGLDCGFYSQQASLDSVVLLYRIDHNEPWQIIPSGRMGNADQGYITAQGVVPGEYTLAIYDPERTGTGSVLRKEEANLFPNPLGEGGELTIEVPTQEPFSLSIFDQRGRLVWYKEGCFSGQKVRPSLAKGTYFALIENNCVSLQSKIIQL